MKDIDVIGLGALNTDLFYRVERLLDDGEAVTRSMVAYPGGSAANTIHGLAKLGFRTGFLGAIGDDDEGQALVRAFKRVGVDTGRIKTKPGVRSGSVLCLSDELGRRSLYVTPGANNLLDVADINLAYIKKAKIMHMATFVDDRQFQLSLDIVSNLGRTVKLSFSPGALYTARGLKSILPILKKTYILFINRQELEQLTGHEFRAGVRTCLKAGCRMVVVTLGRSMTIEQKTATGLRDIEAVSYIRDEHREYVIEACPIRLSGKIDTTGAGDAFAAGFLYGFLGGKPMEMCGQIGHLVAQFAISKMGARQGLPTLKALSSRYQALYQKPL
jgi:ribokinase